MSYQKKLEQRIEAGFSAPTRVTVLDFHEINKAMERAHVMRSEQAGVLARALVRAIGGAVGKLFAGIRQRMQQRQAMAYLRSMDDRLLQDIGLSRAEINAAILHGHSKDSRQVQAGGAISGQGDVVMTSLKHAA